MSQDHISQKRAVYHIAGMERATVARDLVYRTTEAGPLTIDVYYPADVVAGSRLSGVIIVAGYSDAGAEKVFGCKFKDFGMVTSWCQLIAASGLAAIAYTNLEPGADLEAVVEHARRNASALGLDADRLGIWAASGSVPLALSALMHGDRAFFRCAVALCGFMLDLEGASGVADAAQQYRFTNPNGGKTVNDLPAGLPLFIARAGQDQFEGVNGSIDRCLVTLLARNQPVTFVNHATGPHGFDLFEDSETSREIIREVLRFLQFHLLTK